MNIYDPQTKTILKIASAGAIELQISDVPITLSVQEQRQFSTQPEIKTYRMKNIESDMSFHLIWTSMDPKWEKSDFGVSLTRHLKKFGLVSHSVWQQLELV